MVHRPSRFITRKVAAAAVSSSNSTTSSDVAAAGSVKSGKKVSPTSKNASGAERLGAVPSARATARMAAPPNAVVFSSSVMVAPCRSKRPLSAAGLPGT